VIAEAYFIGPPTVKYGYYIIDSISRRGERKEYSVFSGVPRNSLTFAEVKSIYEGQTVTKNIPNRFYKSFTDLNITIKNTSITIVAKGINTNDKVLVNNTYLPPKLHNGFHNSFVIMLNKFKNLIIKNLKKFKIIK
jgi:hypothetical protein